MKIHIIRTAMIGGGLSYDVEVPISDIPHYDGSRYITIIRDGNRKFVNFVDATLPEEHFAMEQGWERYSDFLEHEKRQRRNMLNLAQIVFPELAQIRTKTDKLPLLWVTGLLPTSEEVSAEHTINYSGEVL